MEEKNVNINFKKNIISTDIFFDKNLNIVRKGVHIGYMHAY